MAGRSEGKVMQEPSDSRELGELRWWHLVLSFVFFFGIGWFTFTQLYPWIRDAKDPTDQLKEGLVRDIQTKQEGDRRRLDELQRRIELL